MSRRSFQGKNVVITGATGGLGQALCRRFANAGAHIGGLDLQKDALQEVADAVTAHGGQMVTAAVDIRNEVDTAAAVDGLSQQLGGIDVLVNNAGITHLKNFRRGEGRAIQRVMDVNFMGSVHCTSAALDDLIARRGLIIVLSSVAGFAPLLGRTGYCASKHALHGFFETLRLELRTTGVDVLMVCPSYIDTSIRRRYQNETATDGKSQTIGSAASPDAVADRILRAAEQGKRHLNTGAVGHVSYWARRLVPRFYEVMMLRRIRDEP